MNKTILAMAVASLVSYTSFSKAQNAMDTIVVVGQSENLNSISDIPSNVTVISQDEIKASGATSIASLLRGHAGIQVSDSNSGATLSLRGMSGEQAAHNILILVDGRKLNKPDLSAPQLSSILLSQIEKIEILSGSAGVLYGDQAVGGVINIITRSAKDTHGEVSATLGSNDLASGSVSVTRKITDEWSYSLSGSQENTDHYRDHNEGQVGNLLGRIDFSGEDKAFYSEASYYDNYRQYAGSLTQAEYDSDPTQANSSYPDDEAHAITKAFRTGYQQDVAPEWLVKANASYDDTSSNGLSDNTPFENNNQQLALLLMLEKSLATEVGQGNLLLGVEYHRADFDYLSSYIDRNNTQTVSSIYTQLHYPLAQTVSLVTGGRYSQVSDDITDATTYSSGRVLSEDANAFELGVNYNPNASTRLYLRGETNFRFAKVDEQAYTPADIYGLKPQKGVSVEAGFDYFSDNYSLKADVYNLKLKDEILFDNSVADPSGGQSGANVNADESKRFGSSIYMDRYLADALLIGAEYNYVDAEYSSGNNKGNQVPWVAKHTGRAFINYEFLSNWKLLTEAVYTGNKYQDGDSGNTQEQLNDYWLNNLAINYVNDSFSASLRIDNAFDTKYADYVYYNGYSTGYYVGNGREFNMSVAYQF